MYVQAISKYAPHPNAAKLWMEYLYSDEGQNAWMKGYCVPIRYEDMVKSTSMPPPRPSSGHQGRRPPTLDQITKATDVIVKGWPTAVG